MRSLRQTGIIAATLQSVALVALYLVQLVYFPAQGFDMDWYNVTGMFAFANAHAGMYHVGYLITLLYGLTAIPLSIIVAQRYQRVNAAHAVMLRGFGVGSGLLWIACGVFGGAAFAFGQQVGLTDPALALQIFTIESIVGWGLQLAGIFCYGVFLYNAGRAALQAQNLSSVMSYLAIVGGVIGMIAVPLNVLHKDGGMIGFLVPLFAIVYNIALTQSLRKSTDQQLEAVPT